MDLGKKEVEKEEIEREIKEGKDIVGKIEGELRIEEFMIVSKGWSGEKEKVIRIKKKEIEMRNNVDNKLESRVRKVEKGIIEKEIVICRRCRIDMEKSEGKKIVGMEKKSEIERN